MTPKSVDFGFETPTLENVEFPTKELVIREIEIKGSMVYWNEFAESLELLRLQKINTKGIVTQIIPLKDIQATFTDLLHSREQIKVLVAH